MSEVGEEHARVAFPANAQFAPVGRVTVAGIALRLGIDVGQVENLRLAVNAAIEALAGDGNVTLLASWTDEQFIIDLTNPEVAPLDVVTLRTQLDELSVAASVDQTGIRLTVDR